MGSDLSDCGYRVTIRSGRPMTHWDPDSPVYPNGDGKVYHASSWHRGACLSVVLFALPSPWAVSQFSTEDAPLCLRAYSVARVARAFGVPIELLTQTAAPSQEYA